LFSQELNSTNNNPFIVILGTLQDGGSPHIGCQKDCCKYQDPTKKIVSLGLVDPSENKKFLIEATPEINNQLKKLDSVSGSKLTNSIDGIFLTHAHIGHYSGLMYLGKEAWNSNSIPVYAMPKMKLFLENNGPWSQLIKINNIVLNEIEDKKKFGLLDSFCISKHAKSQIKRLLNINEARRSLQAQREPKMATLVNEPK
jgi:pyrroloquinoline quinone biosynthesis protein B